jgi:hypothetical protein
MGGNVDRTRVLVWATRRSERSLNLGDYWRDDEKSSAAR